MALDDLLARPGLDPAIRLLVATAVAVWRGDWTRLEQCAAEARRRDRPRGELEEVLLQSILFCGFPRVVTAFEHLTAAWPTSRSPHGGGLPASARPAAADALFARIYGRNTAAVHAMLRAYHEELHDFVLEAAYGRILSRPGLDARTREIVAVGVLAAQDQVRQFVGHARGAMHLGATADELREALVTALGDVADVDRWRARLR